MCRVSGPHRGNISAHKKSHIENSSRGLCGKGGRGTGSSPYFRDSTLAFPSLRAEVASSLSRNDAHPAQVTINQEKIWRYVDKSLTTYIFNQIHTQFTTSTNKKRMISFAMPEVHHQKEGMRGYICGIGNGMLLDIFDPGIFGMLHQKLINSYVVETLLQSSEITNPPEVSTIEKWLENIATRSAVQTYPGVDMGKNIRVEGSGIIGSGLILDRQIISFFSLRSCYRKK